MANNNGLIIGVGAVVLVGVIVVIIVIKKKQATPIPGFGNLALSTNPKEYLDSGAYVQGQTVFSKTGTVIGQGIKQVNSQGNVYFNNGSILYTNGDLYDSQDNKVANYANQGTSGYVGE